MFCKIQPGVRDLFEKRSQLIEVALEQITYFFYSPIKSRQERWPMQPRIEKSGSSNPQDVSLHKQIKDIADLLRPELLRLHTCSQGSGGDIHLYFSFIEQINSVKKEISNHDALFAFQNILNHMRKVIELSKQNKSNQEILWHLQDVMSLLFKVQNLPS